MLQKKIVDVLDARMAYSEFGEGDPIVLLHGNPMHGFLWHALVPHVEGLGRLIVPDLIGMGDSARLPESDPDRYSFSHHGRYLDALLEQLEIRQDTTIVCHDWGGALLFDWARRHPERIRGIVYFETHVDTSIVGSDAERAEFIRFLRSEEAEDSVLRADLVLDWFLGPQGFTEPPNDQTRAEILRPWTELGENRRAMLSWIRQAPVDGQPEDIYRTIDQYTEWLRTTPVPKLLITTAAGFARADMLDGCRRWPNQTEVSVPGAHFPQLEFPAELGQAIRTWFRALNG